MARRTCSGRLRRREDSVATIIRDMTRLVEKNKRGGIKKPAINPLVRSWDKNKKTRKTWKFTDYQKELANAKALDAMAKDRITVGDVQLTFAKNTHLNKTTVFGRNGARRLLELLFARFGQPDDVVIKNTIGHMRHEEFENWESQLKWAHDYQRQAQTHTCDWATQAMRKLVKTTGGRKKWRKATDEQRSKLILELFDEAPIHITTKALWFESRAIDIEGIFLHKDKSALRWRKALRLKLLNICLRALEARVLVPKNTPSKVAAAKSRELLDFWKTCMQDDEITELDLGTVKDVPSRSSPASTGRRERALRTDLSDLGMVRFDWM